MDVDNMLKFAQMLKCIMIMMDLLEAAATDIAAQIGIVGV